MGKLHPVISIVGGDFVGLRQGRIVEGAFDEIIDRAAEVHYRLADVNELRRPFADDVDAEQFPVRQGKDHFHHARTEAHDLSAGGFAKTGDAAFVGDFHLLHLVFGLPHR